LLPPVSSSPLGLVVSWNLRRAGLGWLGIAAFVLLLNGPAVALDEVEAREKFRQGDYEASLAAATAALRDGDEREVWWLLKLESYTALGRYQDARVDLEKALPRGTWSIRLRRIGCDIYKALGQPDLVTGLIDQVHRVVELTPWRYSDAESLVTVGEIALLAGEDPRDVLEKCFDQAKKISPEAREGYLGAGRLALSKHDSQIAADEFRAGLKHNPNDPDLLHGLAEALVGSDAKAAQAALDEVLKINPRHVPALLFVAERHLDAERYAECQEILDQVLKINPRQPRAYAYRAVLAHLRHEPDEERKQRDLALRDFPKNPEVDFWIGEKLSRKYRFAEGAACQRKSLAFDPRYVPARMQLSQDLLRLGQEEEGWKLVAAVHEVDGYDVVAFNLLNLKDRLDLFRTLEDAHFLLRMDAREAAVYGPRALALLNRARTTLGQKYGLELKDKIVVEIFPSQADFAIRTFGLPGGEGFLGVCFGKVITANSPAARRGSTANWEAVLWHEFCHVVTLELTQNRIPRWLSEGISVYEERQEDPSWGQGMTPKYREMIQQGELTPVGKLSGAFLNPKSGLHLQFAYYESSLVVQFLVEKFGLPALQALLGDLATGLPADTALARRTGHPLPRLEADFEAYARAIADRLAPDLDLSAPADLPEPDAPDAVWQRWLKDHPQSYLGQAAYARKLVAEQSWTSAQKLLEKLIEKFPSSVDEGGPYPLLAQVHRKLGETDRELALLRTWTKLTPEAPEANLRLIELGTARKDWPLVIQAAERFLSIDPLQAAPYRGLAVAYEEQQRPDDALSAWQTQLALVPENPAEVHFHVARLLFAKDDPQAKTHLLRALEEAPRFRAAQRLLLEVVDGPAPSRLPQQNPERDPRAKFSR